MKSNTNSLLYIKLLVALFCLFATSNLVIAQTRPPQNIRRVTVTTQYVVIDGKYKSDSYAINQEIFDSLGRCHTEVDYGFIDHYPHNYRWHTFNGKQRVKTEVFRDEKLQAIEEFTYNADSLLIKKVIKRITPSDTSILYTLNYKYDSNLNPIEITAKTLKGKTAYVSKSTYNNKGKELTRKVKIKRSDYPQDSILKILSVPIYDSIGRLVSDRITITMANKTTSQKNFMYSYDKNNNQISLLEVDANGKQIQREEREYKQSRGLLSLIRYYNSNDILVKMIGKRYEIYRTNNRRVREIDY